MKTTSRLLRNNIWLPVVCIAIIGMFSACQKQDKADEGLSDSSVPMNSIVQTEWKGSGDTTDMETDEESNPISVIKEPAPIEKVEKKPKGEYTVQVGAFINRNNATRLVSKLKTKGYDPTLSVSEAAVKRWNIVRIGNYPDEAAAVEAARKLAKEEMMETAIVKGDKIIKIEGIVNKPSAEKKKSAKVENAPSFSKKRPSGDSQTRIFSYQVGGLHTKKAALKQKDDLVQKGYAPYLVEIPALHTDETWYAVRIGHYTNIDEAASAAELFTLKESIPAQATSKLN